MIRRTVLVALGTLLLLNATLVGSPFELYRTQWNAALFQNATDETFSGLWVAFAGDVALLQAFGIGVRLVLLNHEDGIVFDGDVPPFGVWEIDWALEGPSIIAAAWIRSDGTRLSINVHAPTARMAITLVPPLRARSPQARCLPPVPTYVRFQALGSMDPDGDALSYDWSWSDGTAAQGSEVSRRFDVPGWYTVRLTVTDPQGNADTASRSFEIPGPFCASCCGTG